MIGHVERDTMTELQMERVIEETASALAVEGLVMSREERENLRRVARGELAYSDLVNLYAGRARQLGASHA